MDKQFWMQRWCDGKTGFHSDSVQPLLAKHWPSLELPAGQRVFVPLAGKSRDMLWLAEQGYRVLGVEISPLAVEQFLAENSLTPVVHDSPAGRHYVFGSVELICGDVFDLGAGILSGCSAVYDRAALIALSPDIRARYADHLSRNLPAVCKMLLVTVDYAQNEMDGPPFAVDKNAVDALYGSGWCVELLERRDILSDEARFAEYGVSSLHTEVLLLRRG